MSELHTADVIDDADLADDVEFPVRLGGTPGLLQGTLGKIKTYLLSTAGFVDTDGGLTADSDDLVPSQHAAKTYIDSRISAVSSGGGGGAIADGIVSGCGVVYSGAALTFNMASGSYYIDQVLYTAAAQIVTLDAADVTNDRIDTFFVDDTGTFGKITGTPDPAPEAPETDDGQLFLLSVTVPAGAVDLDTEIPTESIYAEGVEWAPTVVGTAIDEASTTDPRTGSNSIEATAAISGDSIRLIRAGSISFDNDGNLVLWVKSKAAWGLGRLVLSFYAAGIRRGTRVILRDRSFGFDSSDTTDYQLVVIPKRWFAVPSGANIDELRIRVAGSIGFGFFIDDIDLQTPTSGTIVTIINYGLSQDEADTRYLRQSQNLGDVPDKPAARGNLDVYSTAEVDAAIAGASGGGIWYAGHFPTVAGLPTLMKASGTTTDVVLTDDADVGLILDSTDNGQAGGNWKVACQATPSDAADWAATCHISPILTLANNVSFGLALVEQTGSSGWPLTCIWGPGTGAGQFLFLFEALANFAYNQNRFQRSIIDSCNPIWLRIRWNVAAAKYFFDISPDGKIWLNCDSKSKADLLFVGRASHIGLGFYMSGANASAGKNIASCDYWVVG